MSTDALVGFYFISDTKRRWRGAITAILETEKSGYYLVGIMEPDGDEIVEHRIVGVYEMRDWTFFRHVERIAPELAAAKWAEPTGASRAEALEWIDQIASLDWEMEDSANELIKVLKRLREEQRKAAEEKAKATTEAPDPVYG